MNYSYSYAEPTAVDSGLMAVLAAYFAAIMIIGLIVGVIMIVSMWKIFAKAGEPGWAAIIPFYNLYVMYKIAWGNGVLFLLNLIPVVGVIVNIVCAFKLAKAFGKSAGFGVGLWLLPVIFYPMLAFGKSDYVGVEA